MSAVSSDCRDNEVFVTGLTADVTSEDLELFLESSRYCSIGGTVTEIKLVPTNSALATFEDSKVAVGLLGKSVKMPDGPTITFRSSSSYEEHRPATANNHQPLQRNESKKGGHDCDRRHGEKSRKKTRDNDVISKRFTPKGPEKYQGELNRTTTSYQLGNNCERYGSSRLQDGGHLSSDPKDRPTRTERQMSAREVIETDLVQFEKDILELIKLSLDSTRSSIRDCLEYDFASGTIRIRETKDEIVNVKIKLHEMANNAVSQNIDNSFRSIQNLLSSDKGERWLQEEFFRHQLTVVVHGGRVVAEDEETLKKSFTLMRGILTAKDIRVKDDELAYLHSKSWTENVTEILASRMISVEFLESENIVRISGYSEDVQETVKDISKWLKLNCAVTHPVKSKKGIIRLLKNMKNEIMESNSIKVSLDFNEEKGLINIRGLRDDVESATKTIESHIDTVRYEKYEVTATGVTAEMFKREQSAGRDLIDLLEVKNQCTIEIREKSRRESKQQHEGSGFKSRNGMIQVLKGNIVEFKQADVLVNPVQKRPGAVTEAFMKAGGEKLTEELKRTRKSYDFGSDVFVSSASGSIRSKYIFNAVVGEYRNNESVDRLCSAIKKCLEMAKQKGAKSIAFPTLGCGRLHFRPEQVAECFNKAKDKCHSDLEIFIISPEDDLIRRFQSLVMQNSPSTSHNKANGIAFHINGMNDAVIRNVKEKLAKKIGDMTTEAPIHDKAIAKLSSESISRIKALQSNHVSIEIETDRSTVTVRGEKDAANDARQTVLGIIYRDAAKREREGLGRLVDFSRVPDYWTKFRTLNKETGVEKVKLSSQNDFYKEISRLVMDTWEKEKVGLGNDATGLGQHTIKILKIYCIENPALYAKYMAKKQQHCIAAARDPCPPIHRLKRESRVKTTTLGLRNLEATLSKNVNECFLLHGTKKEIVEKVQSQGLDSRLAGQNAMFGCGTYLSESSTKADQYADSKDQRVSKGSSLYMFVCRVFLGSPFICRRPEQFRRPPCKKCLTERCNTTHRHHENFDSVVGTHRSDNQRLLFREFIIYHPDQSYPDFLVKYERV